MKLILSLTLLIIVGACNSAEKPSFTKKSLINKNLSDLQKKYGSNVQANQCNSGDKKICDETFKTKCSCYRLDLRTGNQVAITNFLTVANNKVVGLHHTWTTSERSFKMHLTPINKYFGETSPTKVMQNDSSQMNFQYYTLLWYYDSGVTMAQVACSKQLAANKKYLGKIGDCYLRKYWMRRNSKYSKPVGAGFKDSDQVEFKY